MDETTQQAHEVSRPGQAPRWLQVLLHLGLPVVLLAGTAWGVKSMLDQPPRPGRKDTEKHAPLVEVIEAAAADAAVELTAMGVVKAAEDVELRAQVPGRVAWLRPGLEPGATVRAGEALLRIERVEYELAVSLRQSEVSQARARVSEVRSGLERARRDLALEEASHRVAGREAAELAPDQTLSELALRQPQLAAAKATVSGAQAGIDGARAALAGAKARLAAAELDLDRTEVTAPSDAVVESRLVDVGESVGAATPLARLVATSVFWVEVAIPERDLRWIELPDEAGGVEGTRVRLRHDAAWGEDAAREGRVIRRLPSVDGQGRMARLLVEVDDPLALRPEHAGQPSLLVGSVVATDLTGRIPPGGVVVPRELLRDGDTVWVVVEGERLDIRPVTISYRGADQVVLGSGLAAGERVVSTPLAAPVQGMSVRLAADARAADTPR